MAAREGRNVSGPATVSLGRVRFSDDGSWRADPSGAPAVLASVHDRYGDLVDLVAWLPDKPSAWWLRYGDECPILGAADLAQAAWYQEPVSLYSTPESWLRARCRARDGDHHHQEGDRRRCCILRWGLDLTALFAGVRVVHCETAELEHRLLRLFRAWEPKTSSAPEVQRHAA